MQKSAEISARFWNQPDKGEREAAREGTFIDDIVQKSHIEKALRQNLDSIRTVFDGGAGSGRFSLLLAGLGLKVTHFDISAPMIEKAKALAAERGLLGNIAFVQGSLEDLSAYADSAFDLVVSFDAPVSYTWPHQEKAIGELVRIAKKRVMLSVSSRLGALPYLANPLQKHQFFLDPNTADGWVQWCMAHREELAASFAFQKGPCDTMLQSGLMGSPDEIEVAFGRGEAPWPVSYHFMPDELARILEGFGVKNIRLAGPGAFARTIPNELLVKIMKDPAQRADFLEFCYGYDQNPYVCGMGKDNLLAIGEI